MVFRPSWLAVCDVAFALYLAGEYVIVDISDSCDVFCSENDSRFYLLAMFFSHMYRLLVQIYTN